MDTEITYRASNHTQFFGKGDLTDGIIIKKSDFLTAEQFAADCIEFGALHGITYYNHLNSLNNFKGYDRIQISVEERTKNENLVK